MHSSAVAHVYFVISPGVDAISYWLEMVGAKGILV